MEGDLEDISLVNLIQMMGNHRRSGGILLERPGQKGLVYFHDGELVDASTSSARGEEAVYQLLGWDEASFRVSNEWSASDRSIWTSWTEILLDGLRKIDEGKHQDQTEDDFVALLSALEQILVKLRDKTVRGRPDQAVELYGDLVNRAAELWSALPEIGGGQVHLEALVAEAARDDPAGRCLQIVDGRLPSGQLEEIHRRLTAAGPQGDTAPPPITPAAVCGFLITILERYLHLIVQRFPSAEVREHWAETVGLFVQEVRATVAAVEF